MTFLDVLVFIFTMIALSLFLGKRIKEERRAKGEGEDYGEEDPEEALREFFSSMNIELPPKVTKNPPKPPLKPQILPIEPIQPESPMLQEEKMVRSKSLDLLSRSSLQDAIILKEILGPPKGL